MRNEKGQAIIEAAIVIPFLLLLVLGVFEFGRAMYIKNTLNNAVRAGARTAAVTPRYNISSNPQGLQQGSSGLNITCTFSESNSSVYQSICDSIANGIPKNEVIVQISALRGNLPATEPLMSGDLIQVTATWDNFQPVVAGFIPISHTMTSEASMRYE